MVTAGIPGHDDWGQDEGAMKTSVGDLISPKFPTTYYHLLQCGISVSATGPPHRVSVVSAQSQRLAGGMVSAPSGFGAIRTHNVNLCDSTLKPISSGIQQRPCDSDCGIF